MQIRRCATLFFELRNDAVFDLAHLLAGGDGCVVAHDGWHWRRISMQKWRSEQPSASGWAS